MTDWKVTIDQRTPEGATSRRTFEVRGLLSDAVEGALDQALLIHAEVGEYQITVTPKESNE